MQPLPEVSLSNESVYSTRSIMKVLADSINPDGDIGPDDVMVAVIWVWTLNTFIAKFVLSHYCFII